MDDSCHLNGTLTATTRCPKCHLTFRHQHHPHEKQGFYEVFCPQSVCRKNNRLLRCCHCDYCTHYRKIRMHQHQSSKHLTSDVAHLSDDVLFSVQAEPDDSHNSTIKPPPLPDFSTWLYQDDIHNNIEIITQRPSLMHMFHDQNDTFANEPDSVMDGFILEQQSSYVVQNSEISLDPNSFSADALPASLTVADLEYFKNPHSRIFFCQQHNYTHGGIRGVAMRSHKSDPRNINMTSLPEADLLFDFLENLVQQSPTAQDSFLRSHHKHSLAFPTPHTYNIEIPTNRKSTERILLLSKSAMYNILPCEIAFSLDNDPHAMISIDDKLDTLFAMGLDFDFFQDHTGKTSTTGFNGTIKGQELYEKLKRGLVNGNVTTTCFGHIILWSDGFLRNFTRQKENSFWILVMRVCAPLMFLSSEEYTFCLAFGQSKFDHDRVIQFYLEEIRTKIMPGKMRYYGKDGVKKMVNTSFGLSIYLADFPERDKICHRLHLGLTGKRFQYAGRIDPVGLPSCNRCYQAMIKTFKLQSCDKCCNWEYETSSKARFFDSTADTNYPKQCCPNNPHIFLSTEPQMRHT